MTPRKFFALVDVHLDVKKKSQPGNDKGQQAEVGFVDQIPGW